MIDLLLVCLAVCLGAADLALVFSPWIGAAAVASTGLLLAALLFRRTALLVGSAALLTLGAVVGFLSQEAVRLWLALAWGLGLLVLLETGWDRLHLVQARLSARVYRRRLEHLARCASVSVASVFLAVTLGYGAAVRFGVTLPFALAVASAAIAGAGAAVLTLVATGGPKVRREARHIPTFAPPPRWPRR